MLRGGCFCGHVRYETSATAFNETNCHCSTCRRISGAPYVTWFTVPRASLRLVAGAPATFASSSVGVRSYCPQCGTQLLFAHAHFPEEIDVTTCSLDHPEQVPPKDHTQTSTQLSWVVIGDTLPKHQNAR